MNSSRQEVLCKYLPLKRRIGILLWILRDESDGEDESFSHRFQGVTSCCFIVAERMTQVK